MQCPACGTQNQPEARFCHSCGLHFEPAVPERQARKTVSVVFCDLAHSTELGERLDPEALRRVMKRYFDAMRSVLERHGGTVEKFIGDAVMAVFGVPQLHEDDALRAVRAADEMRQALDRLNEQLSAELGITISVRIGVNTGPVVTVQGGQGLVTGDAVNVAARLEQAAEPGTILLGQSTYHLVRDAVSVEPIDALSVKGKSLPLKAVRLLSVTPLAEAHARRLDSPMVGRQSELAVLRQSFERTVSQRACQLFTLLGSAGVGKSRLVAEFLAGLPREASVMRGRCLPYGEGITYWPIAEAVRQVAGITDQDSRSEAQVKLAASIGGPEADRVAPLVAELIGLVDGASAQEDLFWAVRMLFEILAAEHPLVVVINDIHWAEATLLDLIDYVADWSRDSPILLLCPARPELLDTRPGWSGGKLNAASLLLEPLPLEASEELIRNIVGGAGLPAPMAERISRAAEGNPLFVEEMIGMLVDDGQLLGEGEIDEGGRPVSELNVPPTIQALLSARLERLSVGERSVAERAAVVGRIFGLPSVIELAAIPGEESAAQVRSDLMGLVRKELVRPERSTTSRDENFRFRHQLIRDAAYEGLPKEERASLHERFANWLERRAGERLAEYEEIVGYHLEQAIGYRRAVGLMSSNDLEVATRAGRHLATAGRKAVARSDFRATVNLIRRALDLLPPDDPGRPLLGADLANAFGEIVSGDQVVEALDAATRDARRLADERLEAHVDVMGWLLECWRTGDGQWQMRPWDAALAGELEPLVRKAIQLFAAAGDDLGLSRAWRIVGALAFMKGRLAEEEVAVETALGHARAAGAAGEEAELMQTLSRDLVQGATPVADGIARCELILNQKKGDRAIEGYMFHALAHLRARLGEFDVARELAGRYRAQLLESGQDWSHAFAAEVAADVEEVANNHEAAAAMLEEGIAKLPNPSALDARLACNLVELGRIVAAEEVAGRPQSTVTWRAFAASAMAQVRARQGRFEDAFQLSDEALKAFEGTDLLGWHAEVLEDRADVMRRAGRPADAAAAARRAVDLYDRKGDIVSAARVRGMVVDEPA
ncbi:MAG: adenylate/guanylate cyclase domain-containing protein [Chloroflexota bacterium]